MRRATALAVAVVAALHAANLAGAAQPAVRTRAEPARPLFGDTFAYVVEVVVDEAQADAVRIVAGAGPFAAVAEPRTTRSRDDDVVRIRVTHSLACLSASCVPRRGARAIPIPRARVAGVEVGRVARVIVRVRPRVSAAAVRADEPAFRRPTELEAPTTRLSAWVLVGMSVAFAFLVVLLPAVVAVSRRGRRTARTGPVDPVARAIRLLRESVLRPAPDRRRAASLAARVVTEPGLADDAARVAWSRKIPAADVAGELAERIERGHRS